MLQFQEKDELIGLIDTNLFKKITKNTNGIHDGFLKALGRDLVETNWVVSQFGWLEYLGLSLRGTLEVVQMTPGWKLPGSARVQYADLIAAVGLEYVSQAYLVRSQAKAKYAGRVTAAILAAKAAEDQRFHSEEFSRGPFADPLFRTPLTHYSADDIVELLSIDYLHRYNGFSEDVSSIAQGIHLISILAEHYAEKRNVVLFRGFKQAWNARLKGSHEDLIASTTIGRINRAINRLKNDADRFDHDLLAYFLLGFAVNGQYGPVTIYNQDDHEEVLCRLAVFQSIVSATWNAWRDLKGIDSDPYQYGSRFRFVNDAGEIKHEIGFWGLTKFLVDEHLVTKT